MTALGPLGLLAGGAVLGGGYLWARRDFRAAVARARARAQAITSALAEAIASPEARRPVGVLLPVTGEAQRPAS